MDSSDYQQLIEETRSVALEYAEQEWPVLKKSNGVEISAHSVPSHKCKVYKAVGEFDVSPAKLHQYIRFLPGDSDHIIRKIHKIVKSWEVLREVSENVYILRTVSKSLGGGIISAREYLDIVGSFAHQGVQMVCATGVDYPYPTDDKCIRAWNHCSGLLCCPVSGHTEKSRLVYLLQTDLKGKIPGKIIDSALPDMQLTYFSNLRKVIKDSSE